MPYYSDNVDILILTAVKDEMDVILSLEENWERVTDSSGFNYYVRKDGNFGDHSKTIAVARPIDMGGVFAAVLATRLIKEIRPACLAMIGICAGFRGKVALGDVIVAERVYKYDNGKLVATSDGSGDELFQDIRTYNLKPLWIQRAQDFSKEWANDIKAARPIEYDVQKAWVLNTLYEHEQGKMESPLESANRRQHCPDWKFIIESLESSGLIEIDDSITLSDAGRKWVAREKLLNPDGLNFAKKTSTIYVAPIATGDRVVEDRKIFKTLAKNERKILGVEMEGAAIGAVAEIEGIKSFIIAKAVSDFADEEKNDYFRTYAIEASYCFLMAFLKECLSLTPADISVDTDSEKFELFKKIGMILTDNKQIFDQYGPMSLSAQRNPMSDCAKIWEEKKRGIVIPNNLEIVKIMTKSKSLLSFEEYKIFVKFREHAEVFARNAVERLDNEVLLTFPKEFEKMIMEAIQNG